MADRIVKPEEVRKIPKAPRNEAGEILLAKGADYYIDVPTDEQFVNVFRVLVKMPFEGLDTLKSGRGQVMASWRPLDNIVIPRELAKKTGHWYLMQGKPLNAIQHDLYGDPYDTPMNFWDHLQRTSPTLFNLALEGAKTVKSAKEGLEMTTKLVAGALIAAAFLAVFIYANNVMKKLPLPEDESLPEDEY